KIILVSYNDQNNPLHTEYTYVNQQEYFYGGELYFSYDSINRLIGFDVDTRSNTQYFYDGNSTLPARASTMSYYHPRYNEELSYDHSGRLVKVVGTFLEDYWDDEGYPLEYTVNYNYDARGNL